MEKAQQSQTATSPMHRVRPGQSTVLLAICLVGLLGIVSLAVDLGYLYLQQRHIQEYADSVASAATVALADYQQVGRTPTDAQIKQAMVNNLLNNGLSTTQWTLDTAPRTDNPPVGRIVLLAEYIYRPSAAASTTITPTGVYVGTASSVPTVTTPSGSVLANGIRVDYMRTTAPAFFAQVLGLHS